jgi:tetratricopeptide (TPR) repeat protein/predicted Ser/Thr protein kinase
VTSPREKHIAELANAVRSRSPEERAAYLDEACSDDAELRIEVEGLVCREAAHDGDMDACQAGTHAPTQPSAEGAKTRVPPAMRISSYRILGVLGEGSMGVVYRAEQDKPHRVVALKVLKAGGASDHALKRFEHEAQMLGRLQHPGIAQIFEAGTADTGYGPQPFFAMELIQGVPLNEYAAAHRLDTPGRLELLVKVCEGVEHAHQKGVIHRDLKPSNILVDESGQPKILDFGIALAVDPDLQTTASRTGLEQLAGTIPYMSFEQVKGDPHELDTRTDVYALGVIGHQLLAGRLPYDLKHKTIPEAVRIISEHEPRRLGTVDKAFRGDIEIIIGKALEKDKTRRYQSASNLAADLQRFLSDEPILARPPSAMYQFRKFAKRNKVVVTAMAGIFVVLLAAFIWTEHAREEAATEAQKATAINEFFGRVLASPDPEDGLGKDVKFWEVLDEAAARLEKGELAGQPEVEGAVRLTLGRTYRRLGDLDAAQVHLTSALEITRRYVGDDHPQTLATMDELALLLKTRGGYSEAEPLYRQALEARRRVLGPEHPETLETQHNLAVLLNAQGDDLEAERLYRATLATRRRALGEEHEDTLATMNSLTLLLKSKGNLADAEQLYRKILEIQTRTLGDDHPDTLTSMNNLGALLRARGRTSEAEEFHRRALVTQRRVLGEEHPKTLTSLNNLAIVLRAQDKLDEAEKLYRETVELLRRKLGDRHPKTLTAMKNLATLLHERGKLVEAEELYRKTLEFLRSELGDGHRNTIHSIYTLAVLLVKKGDHEEAEPLLWEALELWREVLPEGHPTIARALLKLGEVLLEREDAEGAEPLLRECLTIRRDALPAGDWQTANAENVLGDCLTRLEHFSKAEPLLLGSYPIIKARWGESDEHTEKAVNRLIDLYEALGEMEKVAEYRELFPESAGERAPEGR